MISRNNSSEKHYPLRSEEEEMKMLLRAHVGVDEGTRDVFTCFPDHKGRFDDFMEDEQQNVYFRHMFSGD